MAVVKPQRKPLRLTDYDYSAPGAYFLTLCAKDKKPLFGQVVGGGDLDAPQMLLSANGLIVQKYLQKMALYRQTKIEQYVVMPNHIHIVLSVTQGCGSSKSPTPTNAAVPQFVSVLKRLCNREAGISLWQRGYHDRIIRNEREGRKIGEYVQNNPQKWQQDCFYI